MLTLNDSKQMDEFTIYRDVVYRNGQKALSTNFYVSRNVPRTAQDDAGNPLFDFLWYRSGLDVSNPDLKSGGMVTITLEISPSVAERETLISNIASLYGLHAGNELKLLSIPFKRGTVALSFAGEQGEGDFVTQVAGNGEARLMGSQRATFSVQLNKDGAALLWKSIAEGHDVFHARYDLVFDHRLDDIKLQVWCDAHKSHRLAISHTKVRKLTPDKLHEMLIEQNLAGIKVSSEQELESDQRATLEKIGHQMLIAALKDVMFENEDGADTENSHTLRPYSKKFESTLNHTFTQSYPIEQHAVFEDIFHIELNPEQLSRQVRKIDSSDGFFLIMEVKLFCTVDFTAGLIDKIKVNIMYDATAGSGRVTRTGEYLFYDGVSEHTFRTDLAGSEQDEYKYEVEIYYQHEQEPFKLSYPETNARVIVVDVEDLGIVKIQAQLRDVPLDIVNSVIIDFEYTEPNAIHKMILDGENITGMWQFVTHESAKAYRYHVSWILQDGSRYEADWIQTTKQKLNLDMPEALTQTSSVQLIAAGDFSGLAQYLIDLRNTSDDTDITQFTFTQAGDSADWQCSTGHTDDLHYQVRRILMFENGTRRDLGWTDESDRVLVVSNLLRFNLTVIPRLLDLGVTLSMVLLEIVYDDVSENIHEKKTLVLRDRDTEISWAFNMGAPERHSYSYRLTFIPVDGPRIKGEWLESEQEILVVTPINN